MEAAVAGGEWIQMRLVMVGMKGCDVRQLQSFPPPTLRYVNRGNLNHMIVTLYYAMQWVWVHTTLNGKLRGYYTLHSG